MRKPDARLLAENDLCAGARGQFAMTADKISMQVSFDNVFDLQIPGGGFLDVLIDIALRVDDCSFATRADQIRSMSETVEIELLEIHWFLPKPILQLTCG